VLLGFDSLAVTAQRYFLCMYLLKKSGQGNCSITPGNSAWIADTDQPPCRMRLSPYPAYKESRYYGSKDFV